MNTEGHVSAVAAFAHLQSQASACRGKIDVLTDRSKS